MSHQIKTAENSFISHQAILTAVSKEALQDSDVNLR